MRRHFEEASTLPHLDSLSSPPKPKKVCPRKPTAQEESYSTSLSDEAVPYQELGGSCLEEERWEMEEEEAQQKEQGEEGQEEEEEEQKEKGEEEDVTVGPASSRPRGRCTTT
uniref:myelin transcription factor 1-like n=1 Tax=Monopterus albus TaxID=43700 RepID=UPI0009B33085|nr:myelin transcription factor 1-like [Monopterus albus]